VPARVSTRILFADDSVTAQNMGKRILTEAGYEVVAVSNGAAAVKKIAEQKPDIVILDLYMPGYSGLEVCEKIRGSMATLKIPVLLTVGKMEPYRPEDANRVRADGVIVKPFEASDLLAIIRKFEERIVPAPPPLAQQAEQGMSPLAELPLEPAEHVTSNASQPMVDVPDHMASSAAFSDMLGMEPPPSSAAAASAPAIPYQSSAPAPEPRTIASEYELPVAWRREEEAPKTEIELPLAAASAPEPPQHDLQTLETELIQHQSARSEINEAAPPLAPSRPLQIPVYQESAEVADLPEMLPTAAPPIGEIEIPRDPYLEETAAEATRNTIATSTESGLIAGLQAEPQHLPHVQQQAVEMAPLDKDFSIMHSPKMAVDIPVQAAPGLAPSPQATSEAPFTDADFEARVAAALASYNQTETGSPAAAAGGSPAIEQAVPSEPAAKLQVGPLNPIGIGSESLEHVAQSPSAYPEHSGVAEIEPAVPAFEYHPPVGSRFEPAPAGPAPMEAGHSHDVSLDSKENELQAGVEAAARALTSAAEAETHAGRSTIAQAVSRAMERLKPELVDEILRELNNKE
jgi:CheY-like chemotaxis protein